MFYIITDDGKVLKSEDLTRSQMYDYFVADWIVINREDNTQLVDAVEHYEDDVLVYYDLEFKPIEEC